MDLLKKIEEKYKEIGELEDEIAEYDFGTAQYDDVNAELECLYVTVGKMEREYNEIY